MVVANHFPNNVICIGERVKMLLLNTLVIFFHCMSVGAQGLTSATDVTLEISPRRILSATSKQFPLNHMRQLDVGNWDFSITAVVPVHIEFRAADGITGKLYEDVRLDTTVNAPKGKVMLEFPQESVMRLSIGDVIKRVRQKRPDIEVTGASVGLIKMWVSNMFLAVGGTYVSLNTPNLVSNIEHNVKWPVAMNNSEGESFEFDIDVYSVAN